MSQDRRDTTMPRGPVMLILDASEQQALRSAIGMAIQYGADQVSRAQCDAWYLLLDNLRTAQAQRIEVRP